MVVSTETVDDTVLVPTELPVVTLFVLAAVDNPEIVDWSVPVTAEPLVPVTVLDVIVDCTVLLAPVDVD